MKLSISCFQSSVTVEPHREAKLLVLRIGSKGSELRKRKVVNVDVT